MQIVSNDQTVKSDTVQDSKFFSQSLITQAKKPEQIVSLMPAIKKAFDLLGDDKVQLSTKKNFEKWNGLLRWKMARRFQNKTFKTDWWW